MVLDPRFTKTAALAHEWYPIKPGTDMAFFLAVAHVLITEELYDKKFVAEKTSGIEQFTAHVQPYTPEWADKETDIPAADIRRLARELAAQAPTGHGLSGTPQLRLRRFHPDSQKLMPSSMRCWATGTARAGLIVPPKIKIGYDPLGCALYDDNPEDRVDAGPGPDDVR